MKKQNKDGQVATNERFFLEFRLPDSEQVFQLL